MSNQKSNYEKLTSMTINDLTSWLDKYSQFDGAPWQEWFDNKYCSQCESIKITAEESVEKLGYQLWALYNDSSITCAYCEVYKKCKFFPDMEEIPDNANIIDLWLREVPAHEGA